MCAISRSARARVGGPVGPRLSIRSPGPTRPIRVTTSPRSQPRVIIMRCLLACPLLLVAVWIRPCRALAPAVVRLERASRSLAATLIYEGIMQRREPLELFDDEEHVEWWFGGGSKSLADELSSVAEDRVYDTSAPLPPQPEPENASPLLAARAKRAQRTRRALPADLQTPPPVPEGAVPEGPSTAAADLRSGASRGLVRAKLLALQSRRAEFEQTISEMLDPLAAPKVPAFDVAVLLLFLSEVSGAHTPHTRACSL